MLAPLPAVMNQVVSWLQAQAEELGVEVLYRSKKRVRIEVAVDDLLKGSGVLVNGLQLPWAGTGSAERHRRPKQVLCVTEVAELGGRFGGRVCLEITARVRPITSEIALPEGVDETIYLSIIEAKEIGFETWRSKGRQLEVLGGE